LTEEEIRRLEAKLETMRRALEATERRLRIRYSIADIAYRRYLLREIARLEEEIERLKIPKWELISAVIVIYAISERKPPAPYKKRLQAFYNVDALRDARTGRFRYDTPLTRKEIGICFDDFYARWGWIGVPPGTSEPEWIETSEFRFIDEPEGARLKTLSVIEDEEETYFSAVYELIYTPSPDEKKEMLGYVSS